MFSPRTGPNSARRQQNRTPAGRTSTSSLLLTPRRTPLSARPTPTREHSHAPSGGLNYDVQTFGSSLPVKVMEALTVLKVEEQISVKVSESGWAWMVSGDRLIIWKICQTAVAKLCACKELQLPNSQYDYTAEHVAVTSVGPLDAAPVQAVTVLAVAAEGAARLWPSLSQEGNYAEADLDLGDLCSFVVAVTGGSFVVSSSKSRMLRVGADASGRLQYRALQQGQGVLSGIGRRVSSLFGILSPPANDTLHSVLWVGETSCLYALTNSRLSKWEVDERSEEQTVSWDAQRALTESIADAIWGSEGNYEEMRDGVNVTFLDMKLSQAGLVVLAAAWHPSDTPCLVYFCLVTLQDLSTAISNQFTVEVTNYNPSFLNESELHATRLLLPPSPGATAFLYNEELVFACSTGSGRAGLPDERIPFKSPGDGVRGGGCCANLPVFFSQNSGLVAVVARESASILPETVEDSLCSSLAATSEVSMMEQPCRTEPVSQEDKPKLLKAAFLQFCRNDLLGAQALTDELFPTGDVVVEGGELDAIVTQINLDLLDDYPASDPRWAESVPDESAGFPLTSLIILHQLEDKMKAHTCFMDFLLQVGLLERLGHIWVRSSPMATRLLLCEHAEKLQAAMVFKNQHTKHSDLVNRAIGTALSRNNAAVPPSLTGADVFFREVSQISTIFDCLLEEEERSLRENPVDSVQWAEVVLTVNTIIKDMLHAASQYRESKASMYRASDHAAANPEYIPWTALGGTGGIRTVISRQHELILRSMYPHADSELRSMLCEQLVALLDFYLGGYVAQLNSLKQQQDQERYNSLEMEYSQRRAELLAPLLELGQYQWVAALAEKYCDFDILVQMCELTDNQSRLQHYMSKFADQNFADFLFRWYMEKGKRGKLLSQPAAQHQQLAGFLQAHQHLSWLHDIHLDHYHTAHRTLYKQANMETRYFTKKKTLLALSKLAALASDLPEDELGKQVDEIVEQERFLLHQETLPRQLLKDKQQNPDTMPLLSAHQLVQLYICDDNRRANEYDFKKALDLLHYIQEEDDIDIHSLKCQILGKVLRRDDWSSADGNDDPLEAAKDSVFVKILAKLADEGVRLQTYLPEVKELLELDELSALKSKAYFEFVLRANYEHYLQGQM
ncbi:nuclear pore complex protein Nup133 [Phyllopteryx taeniolatus]|uniref:nuclear pore complex protein Nup133 n=1 Tax=Phyllopteryx taeniolatus TaxID=161469 RepID=UPI002AD4E61D|nr:nuclear pore complex protein Nup133 [Phyllopteryx taeniolatus]